jgi:hypothetical protein
MELVVVTISATNNTDINTTMTITIIVTKNIYIVTTISSSFFYRQN